MQISKLIIVFCFYLGATAQLCDNNPCGEGECKEISSDKYRCLCPLGFRETYNGTCVDVDECLLHSNPCGRGATCSNVAGSFACECYNSHYWDGYTCVRKGKRKDCSEKEFPVFLVKPAEIVEAKLGTELRLTCVGSGNPAPNVYWTKGVDKHRLGPMATASSIFYLPNVTKRDIDLYECVLEDCCSGRIARAKVDVSVPSEPCEDPKLQMYGMVWEYKTWDHALQFCSDKGLTLGVIRTKEERKIMRIDAWISFISNPNGKKFSNEFWLWIGVSDRDEEGVFKTVDGFPVEGVAKWMTGVPDDWQGLSPEGQDVVAIHRLSANWDDSYAFHLRPFACQCREQLQQQTLVV